MQRAYYLHAKFTCWAQRHLAFRVLHTRHITNTRVFACVRVTRRMRASSVRVNSKVHYWTLKQPLHKYTVLATTYMYMCVGTNQ